MTSTEQVFAELGRIEPRLMEFAASAPADTYEICAKVVAQHSSAQHRANAVILACLVATPAAGTSIVGKALGDADPLVRIAAVRCFSTLPSAAAANALSLVQTALTDADAGVRKFALKIVQQHGLTGLDVEIKAMVLNDPIPFLRDLAAKTARP